MTIWLELFDKEKFVVNNLDDCGSAGTTWWDGWHLIKDFLHSQRPIDAQSWKLCPLIISSLMYGFMTLQLSIINHNLYFIAFFSWCEMFVDVMCRYLVIIFCLFVFVLKVAPFALWNKYPLRKSDLSLWLFIDARGIVSCCCTSCVE